MTLELALDAATTDPSDDNRAAVVRAFAGAPLYIGVRDLIETLVDAAGRLLESVSVPMLTSNGPDGAVLLVFTSEAELAKRSPQAHPLRLTGQTVRDLVARDGLAGIVLNPAGSWMFLATADLV